MATAQLPTSSSHNRNIVSICLVVGLVALLIFLAWLTARLRPRFPTSAYILPRMREARQRKGIERFILESIPVVKYSAGIHPNEQAIVAGLYRSLYTSPPTREVRPEGTALASVEEGREQTTKEPGAPNSKDIPSEIYARPNRDQSGANKEPTSCPVCQEDFVESASVRILPCGHIYHRRCIDPWLLDFSGTCPLWWAAFI